MNEIPSKDELRRLLGVIYLDQVSTKGNTSTKNINFRKSRRGENSLTTDINANLKQTILEFKNFKKNLKLEENNFFSQEYDANQEEKLPPEIIEINSFFKRIGSDLHIYGIDKKKNHVLFKKGKSVFPYSSLSSGEMRILQMMSFLTYDIQSTKGTPVFIDEPELGFHPIWQKEILGLIEETFYASRQIIVTTHSPFLVHQNEINRKVIVIKRNKTSGSIYIPQRAQFPTWGTNQLVDIAFRVQSLIGEIQDKPLLLVEGRTDEMYFNKIKSLFFPEYDIEIRWVGYLENNADERFTGCTSLDKVFDVLKSKPNLAKRKIGLIYDCDSPHSTNQIKKNLFIYKISQNNTNADIKKGIENSFDFSQPDLLNFIEIKRYPQREGNHFEKKEIQKMKLAHHLCSKEKKHFKKATTFLIKDFKNFLDNFFLSN